MDVNSLPKTVTRQRRDYDLNPGPSAPESSTLTTRLPIQPTIRLGAAAGCELLPCRCGRGVVGAEHASALSVAVSLRSEPLAVARLAVQRSVVLGDRRTLQHLVARLCTHTRAPTELELGSHTWASTPLEHGGSQVERRRRHNRGAVGVEAS